MSNIKKSQVTIYKISPAIFLLNVVVALVSLFLLFTSNNTFFVNTIIVFSNIVFTIPNLINYKSHELIVSKRKIYFKNKFLKSQIILDLANDLLYFRKQQSIVGKVFNYATIELVDKDNKIVKIDYLNNPQKFEEEIIENSKKYLKSLGIQAPLDEIGQVVKMNVENKEQSENDTSK